MKKCFMIAWNNINVLDKLLKYETAKWKFHFPNDQEGFNEIGFIETAEFATEKDLAYFLEHEVLNHNYDRKIGMIVYVKEINDCNFSLIV